MKQSDLKNKWYYRLWQVISLILLIFTTLVSSFVGFSDLSGIWGSRIYLIGNIEEIFSILLWLILWPALMWTFLYGMMRGIVYVAFGKIEMDEGKWLFSKSTTKKALRIIFMLYIAGIFFISLLGSHRYFDATPRNLYVKAINLTDFVENYDDSKHPNAFGSFKSLDGQLSCLGKDGVFEPINYGDAKGFCNRNLSEHFDDWMNYFDENNYEKFLTQSVKDSLRVDFSKKVNEIDAKTGKKRICLIHEDIGCDYSSDLHVYTKSWSMYLYSLLFALLTTSLFIFAVYLLKRVLTTLGSRIKNS